jgi:hypothetical protein
METILSALKAAAAIFVVMALWFLWMTYVRRRSGCRRDRDVLEHMTQGCAGCRGADACHSRKAEEEKHELT